MGRGRQTGVTPAFKRWSSDEAQQRIVDDHGVYAAKSNNFMRSEQQTTATWPPTQGC